MIDQNLTISYPADPDARKTIVSFQIGQADFTPAAAFISPGTLIKQTLADSDAKKPLDVILQGVGLLRIRCDALDATGAVKSTTIADHDYGCPKPIVTMNSFTFSVTVSMSPTV